MMNTLNHQMSVDELILHEEAIVQVPLVSFHQTLPPDSAANKAWSSETAFSD